MAGMAETVRVNVVTRYSVGMVSMLCVSISVRQIATAIQLSLVFFGLRRSGRYRNGSATFVCISVINQLQSSLLFANSAIVGVRALSFAAFMPCSVRTKLGSILARYHSECSQMSSSTVSNSGRVGDNSRRQPRDRESRGCFVDVRSCLRPDFGKLRSRIVVQIVSDLFSKSQT